MMEKTFCTSSNVVDVGQPAHHVMENIERAEQITLEGKGVPKHTCPGLERASIPALKREDGNALFVLEPEPS